MTNTQREPRVLRRGFTVKDLAVTLTCLLVAAGLLVSLTGATRNLSQAQVCTDHLRQLFAGMTAYVNQYNSYPPHGPYPTYMAPETINGKSTGAWDPNIGFIMTHGMGLEPPARDSATGHFKWYVLGEDELPDVVVCPAAKRELMFSPSVENEPNDVKRLLFVYADFFQTSGTCRAATTVVHLPTRWSAGLGGRQPMIPDPSNIVSQHPVDNGNWGSPNIYVNQHSGAVDSNSSGVEVNCYLQAEIPAEVQSPGRVFYLADSREYRPQAGGWPPGTQTNGWMAGLGNQHYTGSRHFGYGNVMYLDGRINRDNQMHLTKWNLDYDAATDQARSSQWRTATFADDIPLAGIHGQSHIMPVLMVKGWEYFFDANGLKAR